MTHPAVSIITPTYNRARYLPGVIRSVIDQGYQPLEYVVLDDGSSDDLVKVMRPFQRTARFESHPTMGETRTVNKALSLVRGDIIFVVTSDDPLLPGAIQAGVDALTANPDAVVAYPDWQYIDADDRVLQVRRVEPSSIETMLGLHRCLPGPGACFRRSVVERVGPHDPRFRYVADFEFWLRAALLGRFVHVPRVLATFRVHPESLSVSVKGAEMAAEDIRMLDLYFARPDLPEAAKRLRGRAYTAGNLHAAQVAGRAHDHAINHLRDAWKHDPLAFARGGPRLWKSVAAIVWRAARHRDDPSRPSRATEDSAR
jgi:glycosyltransferase involved in cell wall biosynthesis